MWRADKKIVLLTASSQTMIVWGVRERTIKLWFKLNKQSWSCLFAFSPKTRFPVYHFSDPQSTSLVPRKRDWRLSECNEEKMEVMQAWVKMTAHIPRKNGLQRVSLLIYLWGILSQQQFKNSINNCFTTWAQIFFTCKSFRQITQRFALKCWWESTLGSNLNLS